MFEYTIPAEYEKMKNGEKKYYMVFLKNGKKPFKATIKGTLATDGINVKSFGKDTNYSFGFAPEEQDIEALNEIQKRAESEMKKGGFTDFEFSELVRDDDRMFIKLPLDGTKKKFTVKSNVKLDLKKLDDLDLYREQGIEMVADIGIWYNIGDKKAGVYVKPTKINFEQDEQPPAKKRRE